MWGRVCVLGVWACVGRVWGVFGACLCGVCWGACGACVLWGCWGVCGGGVFVVERKYRSPLYYPDTLVNPDTCLGFSVIFFFMIFFLILYLRFFFLFFYDFFKGLIFPPIFK